MVACHELNKAQAMSYAAPNVAMSFLFGPLMLMQGIYSKYHGVALSAIALIIFWINVFDAVTDPMAGRLADRYYQRYQRRKPIMLMGALIYLVGCFFLYIPPSNVGEWYIAAGYLTVYVGMKFFDIPHQAWPSELESGSDGRNKLYTLRSFSMFFGTLLFFALPMMPFFSSTEITPETLKWSVVVAAVLLLPSLAICMMSVPEAQSDANEKLDSSPVGYSFIQVILSNRPLLLFLLAVFCSGTGVSMTLALQFIYIDTFLGSGAQFSMVFVISSVASMASLALWYKLANLIGNIRCWLLGAAMMVLGVISIGRLTPGGDITPLLLTMVWIGVSGASFSIMMPSVLSVIVDYSHWKFGLDNAATYFSLLIMMTKVNLAIGGATALAIVGWYGFDPSSTSAHSAEAVRGLRWAIAWLPAIIISMALILIAISPLRKHRHAIILRRLGQQGQQSPLMTSK